jgi:hypothetical protein
VTAKPDPPAGAEAGLLEAERGSALVLAGAGLVISARHVLIVTGPAYAGRPPAPTYLTERRPVSGED